MLNIEFDCTRYDTALSPIWRWNRRPLITAKKQPFVVVSHEANIRSANAILNRREHSLKIKQLYLSHGIHTEIIAWIQVANNQKKSVLFNFERMFATYPNCVLEIVSRKKKTCQKYS